MKTWAPPGFRDWGEHEQATTTLRDWSPTVLTGLVQTAGYARAVLETSLGVTSEVVNARLKGRMERQKHFWARDVRAWFIVDEPSLYRLAGSPETMAVQMHHLGELAAMPNVTVQVLPLVVHPAGASGFVITDSAAYAEHVGQGYVFTEPEAATRFDDMFDSLRAESYRASESAALIREVEDSWTTGASPVGPTPTAATAWRRQAARDWFPYGTPPTGAEWRSVSALPPGKSS